LKEGPHPTSVFFFFLGSALAVWVQNFIIIILTTNTEISRKINLEEGFFFFLFQEGK
jgi:hypothetical protein